LSEAAGKSPDRTIELVLRHRRISAIPALELSTPLYDEKKPLVIMIHGFEAAKEHVLPYAYRMAQAGFHTVFFDAREHGERSTATFRAASPLEKKGQLYDIILVTATDIDTVIGAYADDPRVDTDRIGLMGFSMGGMITYRYCTGNRSSGLRAAVSVIATPDFVRKIENDLARDPALATFYDRKATSRIADRDPASRLAKLPDLPLLILNSTDDEHMPIDHVRSFYRKARDLYGRKDLIQMIEYDGVGHVITAEMMEATAGWLKEHL
jgi:dienelactone hydrolase